MIFVIELTTIYIGDIMQKYIVFSGIDKRGDKVQITTICDNKHIKRTFKRFLLKPNYYTVLTNEPLNKNLIKLFSKNAIINNSKHLDN